MYRASLEETYRPLWRKIIEPLWRKIIEPLRRKIIEKLDEKPIEPLRRKLIEPLRWKRDVPLRRRTNYRYYKSKPLVDQSCVNTVVIHAVCNTCTCTYGSYDLDLCSHKCRYTVRKCNRQSNVKRCRDREPSRINVQKIMSAMRKRKNRQN